MGTESGVLNMWSMLEILMFLLQFLFYGTKTRIVIEITPSLQA